MKGMEKINNSVSANKFTILLEKEQQQMKRKYILRGVLPSRT